MNLFATKKQILVFFLACVAVFCANLALQFRDFQAFKEKGYAFVEARVEKSYEKTSPNGRTYIVSKLKTADFTLYTTSREPLPASTLRLGIVTKSIPFADFAAKSFYAPSFKPREIYLPPTLAQLASERIRAQHASAKMAELYSALYLATPISQELRQDVVNWGVGHIVAISGYHLGLLFGVAFFVLRALTRGYYDRRPYRNWRVELSAAIFVPLALYLVILDFTPSFLRSYLMSLFALVLLSRGLRVFVAGNLILTACVAVAFCPHLLGSIGFYLSCLGVYFIVLYVRYFGAKDDLKSPLKIAAHIAGFEVFVYCAMNVPVYFFFHSASLWQLFVMPLSYLFAFFYPVSIAAHLVGWGGFLDGFFLRVMPLASEQAQIVISLPEFALFNAALILAYRWRVVGVGLAVWGLAVFLAGLLPAVFAGG